ncbi:AraC family transcriptional regulator [Spongiibacter taiwanensis]|uniref:AraC family transcriptional regulator n=1 Tax=Spongiibacter taiwanensis TaxID=1748242 RepID=UPI002035DA12|nr:AraC family transcriptional regulator [Spongiibacter taiwanensis]USA42535.1 AraC family transcriptional regulator [Spongiibacter taiwanensis]
MALTSDWPLPADGIRFLTPQFIVSELAQHPLTQGLYPVAMGYYPSAYGHRMARRQTENYLLIYCTAGKGSLTSDQRRYQIGSGDLVLLQRDHAHSYRADKQDPWTIYWLHFEGNLADEFYNHIHVTSPVLNIGVQPRVVRIFDGLSELRRSAYQLPEFVQGCHQLQALLSYLALLVRQQRPQSGKALDWERLRAIMQEHIHGQLNLDELAASAKLSKYHFTKKFKALSGQSPIQYFINMKVQRACYLLDSTSQSVKQVAAAVGYDDAYYFSRLFKKVIGLSPSDYRVHRKG